MPVDKASLQAIKNIITEIDLLVSTSPQPMPQNRTPRCLELTKAALALTDDILKQTRTAPAAILGHKGGSATAKRHGAEHYRLMAAARKTHAGGRPRKQTGSPDVGK
ncbi:MAG TPA: hypothetical protein VN924_21435 [Bryobacteraceae bacterium]|jgi:hypothetical protein|nr:hypothetical protein [Bryobacteraceae bacterium]